ncbi:RodZ family helix-turn-helix domain-containing protein [Amycolatopsis echigonensis]|uniref:Uncharacterized protein n=1 Tax=Amycolatopsis echigonensis TaxID=2576905 RepID=A0A8E2B0D6_9PSEU|nr:hypothetical protein [Amycolatopsis echigonensis]MBB2499319.1 hypothetical protein [Amycolatopsis echigonensis]
MSEEQKEAPEKKEKNLRMTSVLASALAAVTAALLGSTLGVAGTVIGAGVASVVSTVGGELYLRSLQRTREAARKAMETAARRSRGSLAPVRVPLGHPVRQPGDPVRQTRHSEQVREPGLSQQVRQPGPGEAPTVYLPADLANMPTVRLSELKPTEPEKAETLGEKLRKMRWPLVIGSSAVAFVAALVVLLGLDWSTQGSVSTGLIPRQPDTSQHQDQRRDDTPSTAPQTPSSGESRQNTPTSVPSTTQSAPPSSQATQQPTRTPSSSATPTTSSQVPSASQTPTAPAVPSNAGQ